MQKHLHENSHHQQNHLEYRLPDYRGKLGANPYHTYRHGIFGPCQRSTLGASAMAGIYYYVFSSLAWGFSIGIQIIVARRLGQGKLNRIGVVFEHGLCFVFLLSMTLFLIQRYCSDVLLGASIQSPNIYAAAMEYMSYRHYGIIFVCFNFLFRALYIGLSNTKIIGYSTVLYSFSTRFKLGCSRQSSILTWLACGPWKLLTVS